MKRSQFMPETFGSFAKYLNMVSFFPCCCWVENTHTDAMKIIPMLHSIVMQIIVHVGCVPNVILLPYNTTIFFSM